MEAGVEASTAAEGGGQAESETLRSSLHSLCREDSSSTLHQDRHRRRRRRWQTLDDRHTC